MKTRDQNTEAWQAPTIPEGDTLVFDEPGRVLVLKPVGNFDVCFRAYNFRVTRGKYGTHHLRVKHGGGEESWQLAKEAAQALEMLDSDARFFLLHTIMDAHHTSERATYAQTARTYQQAFADGRLKRRKLRGQSAYKVWIEPARVGGAA